MIIFTSAMAIIGRNRQKSRNKVKKRPKEPMKVPPKISEKKRKKEKGPQKPQEDEVIAVHRAETDAAMNQAFEKSIGERDFAKMTSDDQKQKGRRQHAHRKQAHLQQLQHGRDVPT